MTETEKLEQEAYEQHRVFMQIIEARSKSVLDLWYSTFKQISFYC